MADRLIVSIILNGENLKEFPLKSRTRVTAFLHTDFIQYLWPQLEQKDKDITRIEIFF